MRHFDLVQRLQQPPYSRDPSAVGPMDRDIDPISRTGLEFDYMGSAEFEYGTISDAAQRIVSNAGRLKIVTDTLVRPTYEEPVHFVCTDEQAETVLPVWHEWSKNPRSLERPQYFKDSDIDNVYEWSRTVGWWALNEGLLWTRDIALAEKLKEGFTQRKRELFAQKSFSKRALATLTGSAPR